MRVLASRKGFSLVELLTVIAIIAVLAGIIFPVMGLVGEKARMNKCMVQLHEIGLAVQMFKQDNRKYPDILGSEVMLNGVNVVPMDQPRPIPTPKVTGLFPEYVKAARLYHCPDSKIIDTTAVVHYDPLGDGTGIDAYSYNSYDFMVDGTNVEQHYSKSWVVAASGQTPEDAVKALIPDDTTPPIATGDAERDYERQLKFRTPPDDTVITWCSWHELPGPRGRTPTLFLDGHADALDAGDVEAYQWRVLPKKE